MRVQEMIHRRSVIPDVPDDIAQSAMRYELHGRVPCLLGYAQHLLGVRARRPKAPSNPMKLEQAVENRGQLWYIAYLIAKNASAGVHLFHLLRRITLGCRQSESKCRLKSELKLGTNVLLRYTWQELQTFRQMADRLGECRSLLGIASCFQPVRNRLRSEPGGSVVLRQDLLGDQRLCFPVAQVSRR